MGYWKTCKAATGGAIAMIGLAGIPDDIKTWSNWLKPHIWILDHWLFRIAIILVGFAAIYWATREKQAKINTSSTKSPQIKPKGEIGAAIRLRSGATDAVLSGIDFRTRRPAIDAEAPGLIAEDIKYEDPASHIQQEIRFSSTPHQGSQTPGLSWLHLTATTIKDFGEVQFNAYVILVDIQGNVSGEVPINWQSVSSERGERNVKLEPNIPRHLILFYRQDNNDAYLTHQNACEKIEGPRKLDPGAYVFRVRLKPTDNSSPRISGEYLLHIPSVSESNDWFRFRELRRLSN